MINKNSRFLHRLQAVECRDSSYIAQETPLVFSRAEGSTIWDVEGTPYLDLCAGFGVLALGHNSLVQRQVFADSTSKDALIVHGMGDVYPSEAKVELLETLAKILPPILNRGALALGGGQAVEIAVKTAHLATGAKGLISFQGSYHGLDLGILPLTSRIDFKDPFAGWLPSHLVEELAFEAELKSVDAAIKRQKSQGFGCAGVIVEVIQGRAGVRPLSQSWLEGLADICRQHGVLLIYDEVFTGLGRTGSMSYSHTVPCDLICLGKALGGGLPLSACFGRQEVMDAWPLNQGEAIHTGTFFGHPLACRLGSATIKAIVEQGLPERALRLGEELKVLIRERLKGDSRLLDVRGRGLMVGLEFKQPGLGALLMDRLRNFGVIALASGERGQGLSLTPALNIPDSELFTGVDRIAEALSTL